MTGKTPGNDNKDPAKGLRIISTINPTRLILWLVAITIVSFVIGFSILFLASGVPGNTGEPIAAFKLSAISNSTAFPLDGASAGNVLLTFGPGNLEISGGSAGDNLMEATVYAGSAPWEPEVSENTTGPVKTLSVTDKGHHSKEFFAVDAKRQWKIHLNEQVPIGLDVTIGVGDSRLDLGDLNLTALNVNAGVGGSEIDLGGYHGGRFDAMINSGVGDLELRVPSMSNTRITTSNGLGDVDVKGLRFDNGAYVTPGYDSAKPVNEIQIQHKVGSVTLEAV